MSMEHLNLSTFNARGLGDATKRRTVFGWLKRYHSGIVFLQETHTHIGSHKTWENEWKGQVFLSSGTTSSRGVAILISAKLNITVEHIVKDTQGRFILLDARLDDQNFILVNIYAPTKDKKEEQKDFFIYIHDILIEYMDRHLLVGGDFNICLQPEIDKKGGILEKQSDNALMIETLAEELDLVDVWRILNPDSSRFTRREMSKNGLVQSRLDFWLISNHLLYDFCKQDIKPGIRSDHSIVEIVLEIHNSQRKGKGFFKFNSALLKDNEYTNKINTMIDTYINEQKDDENHAVASAKIRVAHYVTPLLQKYCDMY